MGDCYRVGWERNPVVPSHWVNKYHSGNQKYFPNNVKQKIFHYKTKKKNDCSQLSMSEEERLFH